MSIELNTKNFKNEILDSTIPALVDFWAEWCMPCRVIAPVVDEIAKEYQDSLKVGKVNVDQEQELAMKYSIVSIPTLLLFKDGKVVETIIGAVPKNHILSKIKNVLGD